MKLNLLARGNVIASRNARIINVEDCVAMWSKNMGLDCKMIPAGIIYATLYVISYWNVESIDVLIFAILGIVSRVL
jgi:hypothetical protein